MSKDNQLDLKDGHIAPISQAVVNAVAAAKNTSPLSIKPLYEVVDPDALELLFASPSAELTRPGGKVEFTLEGCTVRITVTQDDIDIEVENCEETE